MQLLTNLVEYWPLYEASGSRAGLHAGKTLTDNNTVLSATGLVYALAADFERGNLEHLTRANEAAFQVGDEDFTWAAWAQLESDTGDQMNVLQMNETGGLSYSLHYEGLTNNRWEFTVDNNTGTFPAVLANNYGVGQLGAWVLLVAWHDAVGDSINIQVNNGTPNTTAWAGGVFPGDQALGIGGRGDTSETFDGLLGPVMFWRRVLTADQRTWLYNGGRGRQYGAFQGTAHENPLRPAIFTPGRAR